MCNNPDPIFCEKCHAELRRKYKFCPICGKRRNNGAFREFRPYEPYYGDERVLRIYYCLDCEHKWHTDTINPDHNQSHYCPFCRGSNFVTEGTAIID